MSLVLVQIRFKEQYKGTKLVSSIVRELALQMPEIVHTALAYGEGSVPALTIDDVEVWCDQAGNLDINIKDVEILVSAPDSHELRMTLERRKDVVVNLVHDFFSYSRCYVHGFVLVQLQPSAFGYFN